MLTTSLPRIACDDGDVLAYYTHLLQEEIHRQIPQLQAPVSSAVPFFHENVGSSTWGLALRMFSWPIPCSNVPCLLVHRNLFSSLNVPAVVVPSNFRQNDADFLLDAESRLIAVSSNLREVTVFAHGYTAFPDPPRGEESSIFLEGKIRCIELQASVGNHKFTQLLGGDIAGHRHYNCRCWRRNFLFPTFS